jgi:hypothetical protein
MAALGPKVSLGIGESMKLNSASVAGAGTLDFVITGHPAGKDFSAIFQVVGTLTTLTSALQIALDGVTFVDYVVAASFLTTANSVVAVGPTLIPASTQPPKPLIGGIIYRINITASTGGQDFWVCVN